MNDIVVLTLFMIVTILFYVANIIISSTVMRRCKAIETKFDAISARQAVIEKKLMDEFKNLIEHLK